MDRVKTATVSDARTYFRSELHAMLNRHKVSARGESVEYLSALLLHFMESKNFFAQNEDGSFKDTLLADIYRDYLQANGAQRTIILQRLGDLCLMMSGFFAESVHRKTVDIEYYLGMGGTAYAQLSQMQLTKTARFLYSELSEKFQPFSNVLGEISERSGLQSNQDILRLYERWLVTGSDRLRTLLTEQGIAMPVASANKTRQ